VAASGPLPPHGILLGGELERGSASRAGLRNWQTPVCVFPRWGKSRTTPALRSSPPSRHPLGGRAREGACFPSGAAQLADPLLCFPPVGEKERRSGSLPPHGLLVGGELERGSAFAQRRTTGTTRCRLKSQGSRNRISRPTSSHPSASRHRDIGSCAGRSRTRPLRSDRRESRAQ